MGWITFLLGSLLLLQGVRSETNVTVFDNDPVILYQGVWATYKPVGGNWAFGGEYHYTNATIDPGIPNATFSFTGVAIYYWAPKWPFPMTTQIRLDNEPSTILVDLQDYSSSSQITLMPTVQSQVLWSKTGLKNMNHTVQISRPAPGNWVVVNALTYTSTGGGGSSTGSTSSASTTCHSSKTVAIVVPAVLGTVIVGLLILLAYLLILRRRRRRAAKDTGEANPPMTSTGMRSQQSIIAPFPVYPQSHDAIPVTRDGHSRLPSDGESVPGSEGDSLIPSGNISRGQGNIDELVTNPALPLHPVPFSPTSPALTYLTQDTREASLPEILRTGSRTHSGPRHPSLHQSILSPVTPPANYPPFDLGELTRPGLPEERSRSFDSGPTVDSSEGTNPLVTPPIHLVGSPMESGMLPVAIALDDEGNRRFSSPPPEYTPRQRDFKDVP